MNPCVRPAGLVFAMLASQLTWAQLVEPDPPPAESLKTIPIPAVVDQISGLDLVPNFIADESAAVQLGKALFWDAQAGSDGQACASCHFHAGADNRTKNQLAPGKNGGNDMFDPTATGGVGPNHRARPGDFPFHQLMDPDDADSPVLFDTDDVMSSQGVFGATFNDIIEGDPDDDCTLMSMDPEGFHVNGVNVRRVEPRNTPTVINAVFNHRNFWDGRANNIFNGVDPFGYRNEDARVLEMQGGSVVAVQVAFENSSLASQAVGPPLSDFEMSCAGRIFPKLGKKLLSLPPLADQRVHPNDSVLGGLSNAPGNGLTTDYAALIQAAFPSRFWDSNLLFDSEQRQIGSGDPANTDQYTLMESNFALFWGLAIQAYEATLVSDDSPFDRFAEGDEGALTDAQKRGMDVFLSRNAACFNCHQGPEFSSAAVSHFAEETPRGEFDELETVIERMRMADEELRYQVMGDAQFGAAQWQGTAGVRNLPTTTYAGSGGEFKIGVCRYDTSSFMMGTDGRWQTEDVTFTGRLMRGNPFFCGNSVTVFLADNDPEQGSDYVVITRDDGFEYYNGFVTGGDLEIIGPALYDAGFYNIGVRPIAEDAGVDAMDGFGYPLSFAKQWQMQLLDQDVPDNFVVKASRFEVPFHYEADAIFFPGGFWGAEWPHVDFGPPDFVQRVRPPVFGRGQEAVPASPSQTGNNWNLAAIENMRMAVGGSFKTPTLRNVELTGPFFHNGGQATLEQVVDFYNRGSDFAEENRRNLAPFIRVLDLTDEEKADLVAFIKALTDERVRCERAPFDHPSLVVPFGSWGDNVSVVDDGTGRAVDGSIWTPAVGAAGREAEGYGCLRPFMGAQ